MSSSRKWRAVVSLAVAAAAVAAVSVLWSVASGGIASESATPSAGATPPAVSPGAVADFVNREVPELLRHSWVPGATVSVVQGDRILFLQGYGLANVATHQPVDAEKTLFRVGSITKVMTTTAALRLVEEGKLSLDVDVNQYLHSTHVAATFPEPITARLLMHHRGGLESNLAGMVRTRDAETILSPQQRQGLFVRARPVTAPIYYDNLGFGLLGTVVADIYGTTYREAVRALVFAPLDMKTAVAGLPPARASDAATCYQADAQGRPAVCEQELIVDMVEGGGDVSATAADMAHFMRALLVPRMLLKADTLARMKDTDQERLHPLLPGLGLNLREADYAGRRSIGHHGSIAGFNSEFALFPSLGLGVFISVNGDGAPGGERVASTVHGVGIATGAIDARPLVEEFVARFASTFVPPTPRPASPALATLEKNELSAAQLAGVYSRPDETARPPGQTVRSPTKVQLTPDGKLDAYGCAPFVRKAPMYYECVPAVGDVIELGFARAADGKILLGHRAIEALEHQP